MALNPNELFASATGVGSQLRVQPISIRPKKFASGSGTLAALTPVTFNEDTAMWQPWVGPGAEVNTVTKSGTVSGGDYTLTVNGEETGDIAYNAVAADIQAALEALADVAPGDVVVTGGPLNTTPVVITYGGNLMGKALTTSIDHSGLTGGGSAALVDTTPGVNAPGIRGFVWPDAVTLDADEQVLGQVLLGGTIHLDDIPITANYTLVQLKAHLAKYGRSLGFTIDNLPGAY